MRRFSFLAPLPLVALATFTPACGDDDPPAHLATGGQGGTAPTTVCTPGETQPCFSSNPSAVGVGICKAGFRVCADDGLSHGACQDEVGPVPETCATPVDDDCDGEVNEAGVGCECDAGQTIACYGGPAATQDVGACTTGSQTCLGPEEGFGACTGEMLPSEEICGTTIDESCDGSPYDGCPGDLDLAISIPDGVEFTAFVPLPDGGIAAFGYFYEPADLGGGELVSQGSADALAVRFAADGSHVWSRRFGGVAFEAFVAALSTPSGGYLISARQTSPTDYGGGLVGDTSMQPVLLELDAAGDYVDHELFQASAFASGRATFLYPNGDRLMNLNFSGDLTVGGQTLSSPPGGTASVTGRMSPAGTWVWLETLSSDEGVATLSRPHPAGGAVVLIQCQGAFVFDGVTYTCDETEGDSLIVRVDESGDVLWTLPLMTPGFTDVWDVLVAPNGDITFFVYFEESLDLGGGPLFQRFPYTDLAIGRVDAAGNHLWSKQIGSTIGADPNLGHTATPHPNGGVIAAFYTPDATIDLGGGEIGTSTNDLVFTGLAADGSPLWYRHAATTTGPLVTFTPATVDAGGNTWFYVGHPNAPLDLGTGPLPAGYHLVRLAP